MTKNHGVNIVILLIWAMLTLGGLGTAAMTTGIYWVPFAINALIAVVLGVKEFKAQRGESGKASSPLPGEKPRDLKTGRYIKSNGGKAK